MVLRICSAVAVGGLTAATLLVPAAAAGAAAAPPIVNVKIGMNSSHATGGDHLRAGWVTFHITANEGGYFFSVAKNLQPGASNAPVASAPPAQAPAPAHAGANARRGAAAQSQGGIESEEVGLGGGYLATKRGADYTVKLPQGQIEMYISAPELTNSPPPVILQVGGGTTNADPGHADVTVATGDGNRIDSPSSLPRTGRMKIVNRSGSKWHSIFLTRVVAGASRAEVLRYFRDPSAKNPLRGPSYTGLDALAGNRAVYLTYHLPPGRYAFYDYFIDERTRRDHASAGAVTIVTVK